MSAVAELEHLVGYTSRNVNTVHYHPLRGEILIYSAAAAIIIEDVNDPHKQEFLRGHDAEISALDVSRNGKLIASGQLGSPGKKGALAPVIVWDFDARQRYVDFGGLSHSVLCVRFSPDGRFLIGTGANQMIFVWDVATGETVYSRRTEAPCFLGVWGPVVEPSAGASRYPSYTLCTAYDNTILLHDMAFDIRSMCYALNSEAVQFPSSGLQRKHICGVVHGDSLLTGTSAGDICVFSLKAKVFRSAMPVCNNGVSGIGVGHGGILYVAGGDGRVKALRGADTRWDTLAENVLESGVSALTVSADGAELAVGTRNGKLWRLLASDLTATLQAAAHTGEVTAVAFGSHSSERVLTVSDAGEAFVIDLSDYAPVVASTSKTPARCAVVAPPRNRQPAEAIVGYEDGTVRAWCMDREQGDQARLVWQVNAHRGGVTAVNESADFLVTGGCDFAVRFWHRGSRELLTAFTYHRKPPAALVIDNMTGHIVHSGAEDKMLVTYDLKQNKPLIQHVSPNSAITDLCQRIDQEHEIVSASTDGRILFWDVDYPDPTGCLEFPGGNSIKLRCCAVSPSGRYIAAGAEDGLMFIYDLMSCQCIQECFGHSASVASISWSPDMKQIISVGRDGCVIVWNFFEN